MAKLKLILLACSFIVYPIWNSLQGEKSLVKVHASYERTITLTEVTADDIDRVAATIDLMMRLIHSEAHLEPFEGKRAVGDVVVHISNYKGWTIAETIFDPGRFDGIYADNFHVKNCSECRRAAELALGGHHIVPPGVMFYHNPITSTDRAWVNYISKYPYRMIGLHLFCYHPEFFSENT